MKIYAVRDAAVEAFLQPFFSPTDASAVRSLTIVVNDEKHEFYKHAADYSLWDLGDFDDTSGVLTPTVPIKRIVSCEALKNTI